MKCYRSNCSCDKYKMMGCIFRITKEQKELLAEINGYNYCECGEITVKAKYGNGLINLCTKCGVRKIDEQKAV